MLNVAAGRPLIDFIALCKRTRIPFLMHGCHGVGKSEMCAQAASELGINYIDRDLSLMESIDLAGFPRVEADGRTHYAAPSFLPTAGDGLILFEEINRCPRYMQTACLQLLTTFKLNDYRLPPGWLPGAAVNDAVDGYLVDDLDDALLARFVRVRVIADREEWSGWARSQGIHERVIEFIHDSPEAFGDPAGNPRSWTYAARLLTEWESGSRDANLLATALAGTVGDKWASAFMQVYTDRRRPLQPDDIITAYPMNQACIRRWVDGGHLDAVAASVELLKRRIQSQRAYDRLHGNPEEWNNLESFIRDLPGDLRSDFGDWLAERGFVDLAGIAAMTTAVA